MTNNEEVRLIVHQVAYPDQIDAVKALMTSLIEPTRRNPACLDFQVLQNQKEPEKFTLLEHWQNAAAVQANGASPAMAPFRAQKDKLFKSLDAEFVTAL